MKDVFKDMFESEDSESDQFSPEDEVMTLGVMMKKILQKT